MIAHLVYLRSYSKLQKAHDIILQKLHWNKETATARNPEQLNNLVAKYPDQIIPSFTNKKHLPK
jgi:hypothetical protein